MIDSIAHKNVEGHKWDTWAAILTISYQVLFFLVVLVLICFHFFLWKPSYTIKPGIEMLLNPFEWENEKCNEMFDKKVKDNDDIRMKILQYPVKSN